MIKSHTYEEWSYTFPTSNTDLPNCIDFPSPLTYKWFHNDLIDFTNMQNPVIVHSQIKTAKQIPGILILDSNRTYGRTNNKKRLLYKCIPDDKHLPHFLVPYDIIMDFSKVHVNKFVLFKFQEWTEEHPRGMLIQTLGDVNHLPAFYEYQLYSKSLNSSLKEMTDKVKAMTKKKSVEDYFQEIQSNPRNNIEDCINIPDAPEIFTIDPLNALDFDDGLSIQTSIEDPSVYYVTVYITNVVFWLDLFQLWDSFDNRVATIYLPDKRRPMLPSVLTDTLCSLKEKTKRFAMAIKFTIRNDVVYSDETVIQNVVIMPYKNYVYEDPKLVFKDKNYIRLFNVTSKMDSKIRNSRDLVAYWMIKVNRLAGARLSKVRAGIYRVQYNIKSDQILEKENYEKLDEDTKQYLEYKVKAKSVLFDDQLGDNVYVRISSVLRRYEDICNQRLLLQVEALDQDLEQMLPEEMILSMNEKYEEIKRLEWLSNIMKRMDGEGVIKLRGLVYSIENELNGKFRHKIYIRGEGIYYSSMREKFELYKEYDCCLYKKENGQRIECEIKEVA
jgi:exoribonuclease R